MKKMVNVLSQQYKIVFTIPKDIPDVSSKPPQNRNSISKIIVTDKDIKEVIDDITITSAPGPDGITSSIFKEYAVQIIYPIKKI